MLKGNNKYYLLLLVLFTFLVWVEYNSPKPVDWRRTYQKDDKIPYGCNALYRLLSEDLFKKNVQVQKQTPFNVLQNKPGEKTAYVFITNSLAPSRLDCEYLMNFVEEGNEVFFSSLNISNKIADTFHIETRYQFYNPDTGKVFKLNFFNERLKSKEAYAYKNMGEEPYFASFDTSKVIVLATSSDSNAVLLKVPYGKGCFYFNCTPNVFSNYQMVNSPNRNFAYGCLSYLQSGRLYWDEYYKAYNVHVNSPLQFIFGNKALYAAYILLVFSLLVFMLFALKRRQRAIPVVEPYANNTLQFIEVIGSVYYKSKNHKIIAEEKIQSFLEFLRRKFNVSTSKLNDDIIHKVAVLSGIEKYIVQSLFKQMEYCLAQNEITEDELLKLNASIETFHQLNKR